MDGLLSSLEQYFYLQGLTYNRAEIAALIAASGEGSAAGGAIFAIDNSDPDFYEQTGTDAVIMHPMLIGKKDYPVQTTQTNTFFRPSELTYNDTDGKFTIPNFTLASGEIIIVFAIGAKSPDDITGIVARLTLLEKKMQPFTDGLVIVPWLEPDLTKSPPAGWVEYFGAAGRVLRGLDTSNPLFNTVGKALGDDVITEVPKHHHSNPSFKVTLTPGTSAIIGLNQEPGVPEGETGDTGEDDGVSVVNKYTTVRWIKWVGI